MTQNLSEIMQRFPATNMAIFRELHALGHSKANAQLESGEAVQEFCAMASLGPLQLPTRD